MAAVALLKILAGAQAGAEVPLPPGRYVLGSADDADLVLSDAAVRPRHAALDLAGSAWTVEPLEASEVRLAGILIQAASSLSSYQVISLGGVHLALGPDGAWSTQPEIPVAAAASATAPADEPPANADNPRPAAAQKPGSPPAAALTAKPTASSPARPDGKSSAAWPILLFLVLAAGLAGIAWLWLNQPPDPAGEAARSLGDQGFAVLYPAPADPPPAGVVGLTNISGGLVAIHGLVGGEAERRAVLAAAGLPENRLVSRLTTVDEAVSSLAGLLAEYPEARLSRGESRFAVRLSGLLDSAGKASELYRRLRENLDPRLSLRRDLWIWPELRREAEREASRLGLAGARFEFLNRDIRLEIDPWPEPRLIAALEERLRESLGDQAARLFAPALTGRPPEPEPYQEPESPPEPPPEIQLALAPVAPLLPELEPGVGVAPIQPELAVKENEPVPAPEVPPPAIREWRVIRITNQGFTDQDGQFHALGEYLASKLKLVAVWRKGVVLQREQETLFVPGDAWIREE
ncbi:MAG: hypothetical protein LBV15_00855 [Planctomycetota bacterium]|jgi:type III secretion system YscD/HrpQ family protein|nr:hypothetical protein [Planctomycetota bacterium]